MPTTARLRSHQIAAAYDALSCECPTPLLRLRNLPVKKRKFHPSPPPSPARGEGVRRVGPYRALHIFPSPLAGEG